MKGTSGGSKPKLLLIAYRAFGDWFYTVPVLPFLFEKYEVHLECNRKVYSLAYDDERFCGITAFDDTAYLKQVMGNENFDKDKHLQEHLQRVYDEVKPDKVIDLSFSHENNTIASRGQEEFLAPIEERRVRFGNKDYYEAVFKHIGMEMPEKFDLATMYWTPEQIGYGERWRNRHISDFLVVVPIMGSCMQKFYPYMNDVITHIVDTYHNAHVYIMGEAGITEGSFCHDRVYDMTGKLSIKQSVLMTKYADYVIGPETGLVVAAGMWGTHKTMLCNTVSVKQVCGKHDNDHSLQSLINCSPCHRGIYTEEDCENIRYSEGIPYSECVNWFKLKTIFDIVKDVYETQNIYNGEYFDKYVALGESELGGEIYKSRWEMIEKHCHGDKKLLDYGCASGAFISSARNGFIVSGYDINPHSPYHEKPEDSVVDILTMWDVVEHLNDPQEPIRRYSPDYVFLSTPNLHDNVDFDSWKHNRPGEHLHYFNETSLTEMLNDLGYKILDMNFVEGKLRSPERAKDIISVAAVKV